MTLNVPLNNKGPLIGYFGENWSDADVIRSEMLIQDLALTDNPYRTDVHDGYERYYVLLASVSICVSMAFSRSSAIIRNQLFFPISREQHILFSSPFIATLTLPST